MARSIANRTDSLARADTPTHTCTAIRYTSAKDLRYTFGSMFPTTGGLCYRCVEPPPKAKHFDCGSYSN